ncbi:MAG: GAF domain-containing protein [Acidimicrobiia bacterium]|nr:GAF domain-containing protein [Acidimicrobiia bacterium]
MTEPRTLQVTVIATAALQVVVWAGAGRGWLTPGQATALHLLVAWGAILTLALVAARSIGRLRSELQARQVQHEATLSEVDQLATLNEMLTTAGQSKDVGLAFQALARRIGTLIPCDRLGLALVKDDGQSLQVYSSRVSEPERRRRPRAEQQFGLERSIFGQVIRTCDPVLIEDTRAFASDFHDAGVLASQGFHSLLILPLISRNRAIGALTVISERTAAFTTSHRDLLQPLAEVLAFAYIVHHQYLALDRYRTMEATAEMTLSIATDINSGLQVIAGQCGILQKLHPGAAIEIDAIARQTERISSLLDRMRGAADERLREAAAHAGAILSSPEEFADNET